MVLDVQVQIDSDITGIDMLLNRIGLLDAEAVEHSLLLGAP